MLSGIRLRNKVQKTADIFAAVSDSTRLAILYVLLEDPAEPAAIIARIKRSPSLIAHHLFVLQKTGWVTKTKYGKLVTYYLSDDKKSLLKAIF